MTTDWDPIREEKEYRRAVMEHKRKRLSCVMEMRESGMSFHEIGKRMGLSRARVHQLYWKAERLRNSGVITQ